MFARVVVFLFYLLNVVWWWLEVICGSEILIDVWYAGVFVVYGCGVVVVVVFVFKIKNIL